MNKVWKCFSIALLFMVAVGCKSEQQKQLGSGDVAPAWPELDTLQTEATTAIGMAMEMGGPADAKRAASQAGFKKVVDDFANAPIPKEFATSEREQAKNEIVNGLRAIAEGGDVAAEWAKVESAIKTITTP